jgi:hypothetical protein
MWCRDCQQDLPGIASVEDDRLIWCARCNALMTSVLPLAQESDDSSPQRPARSYWRDSPMAMGLDYLPPDEMPSLEDLKFSTRQAPLEFPCRGSGQTGTVGKPLGSLRMLSAVGWFCVSLGLLGHFVSAIVMGWSLRSGSANWWLAGTVVFLASQLLLLLGLLFHLDCIWQRQRSADSSLRQLTSQISELQEVVHRLSSSEQLPKFYEVTGSPDETDPKTLSVVWREQWESLSRSGRGRDAA